MYQKLSPDIWGLIFADQLSLITFQSYLIMVPGELYAFCWHSRVAKISEFGYVLEHIFLWLSLLI